MSTAHLFPTAEGLVVKALRGLIAYNPALALDADERVVFDTAFDGRQVAIVSGGGSGHEPAWAGYVGTNMLAAAAQGDIFASPSTRQVLSAINRVPSEKGTILVITNYTGDCLHFGLAAEKAAAAGHAVRMIVCGDDVSVGRAGGRLVGRRGLAGQVAVLKAMGGCAAAGGSLDEVYGVGLTVSKQIVSMAATLAHCHVPGRSEAFAAGDDAIEIGTGPHNEPGHQTIRPAPTAAALVARLLAHCLDPADADRAYVAFAPADETALLVSNFGGLSQLELSALVDEVLGQIERDWPAVQAPARVYAGCIETSLNAPAFSLSVVNLSAAARDCQTPVGTLLAYLDLRTTTFWESFAGSQQQQQRRPRAAQLVAPARDATARDAPVPTDESRDLRVDPARLERGLRRACTTLAAAEPDLTRWDTQMGDGDCGETLKTGALALLAVVDARSEAVAAGSVLGVLAALEHVVELRMGGTLGGILGIFLVALRASLQQQDVGDAPLQAWSAALKTAVRHLAKYTPAQVGDRTVMDTLIPLANTIEHGFAQAVQAAEAGAESTRALAPKLGRATYVGAGQTSTDLPPDPGAYGVMVAIRGLLEGYSSDK